MVPPGRARVKPVRAMTRGLGHPLRSPIRWRGSAIRPRSLHQAIAKAAAAPARRQLFIEGPFAPPASSGKSRGDFPLDPGSPAQHRSDAS